MAVYIHEGFFDKIKEKKKQKKEQNMRKVFERIIKSAKVYWDTADPEASITVLDTLFMFNINSEDVITHFKKIKNNIKIYTFSKAIDIVGLDGSANNLVMKKKDKSIGELDEVAFIYRTDEYEDTEVAYLFDFTINKLLRVNLYNCTTKITGNNIKLESNKNNDPKAAEYILNMSKTVAKDLGIEFKI